MSVVSGCGGATAVLQWCSVRRCREVEQAKGSESRHVDGVADARCLSVHSSLTGRANAGLLPPRGGHGLCSVGHDAARVCGFRRYHHRLAVQLNDTILPNSFVHYKNFLNESCRATCDL